MKISVAHALCSNADRLARTVAKFNEKSDTSGQLLDAQILISGEENPVASASIGQACVDGSAFPGNALFCITRWTKRTPQHMVDLLLHLPSSVTSMRLDIKTLFSALTRSCA